MALAASGAMVLLVVAPPLANRRVRTAASSLRARYPVVVRLVAALAAA